MDELIAIINLLNQNAAAVTAVATVAIAVLTLVLAAENRKLRKAGTEPEVIAYLAPHPDGSGGINFVLANVGQGPAKNVQFTLENDEEDFEEHEVLLRNDGHRAAISVLPQGEQITSLFGVGYVLARGRNKADGKMLNPFTIEIVYKDVKGKLRRSRQNIDVSQFSGLRGIFAKPDSRILADTANKIEKHLERLSTQTVVLSDIVDATELNETFRNFLSVSRTNPKNGDGNNE